MAFMAPLLVGSAATATAAATTGLIGAAGAVTAGGLLTTGGTILGLMGSMNQADQMRATAQANARNAAAAAAANQANANYQAGQEAAAGQHQAEQDRRKAMLMLSRAQAVAASSGGGPLDESIASGILDAGERQAGYTMYTADERAKSLRYKGDMGVYEANANGRNEIKAANKAADATVMSAFAKGAMSMSSMFSPGAAPGIDAGNYQVGTKGYSGNYLEYDA